MRPRISVCVIARDEERNLPSCLAPLRPLVDEIVVLDTGSCDQTREVARQYGAQVYEALWSDDFAAARNECLQYASGEWILWLDADDRLDSENLSRLANLYEHLNASSADAYWVQVLSSEAPSAPGSGYWDTQHRLQRRDALLHWRGRVHEELAPDDPRAPLEAQWSDLVINHVGGEDPARNRRKLHSDLRLAQLERASRPGDPLAAFAIGWSCFRLGRFPEALRLLRTALAAGHCTRKLYSLLTQTLAQLGQNEQALQVCNQGLIEFPDDPELLYHRGVILVDLDDLDGASQTLVKLVNLPPQRYVQVGVDDGLQGVKARCVLGRIYLSQQRVAEAEVQFRTALRHQPRSAQSWLGLGQMYIDAGLMEGYRHAVAELRQCPGGATLLPALNAHRISGLVPGIIASRSR